MIFYGMQTGGGLSRIDKTEDWDWWTDDSVEFHDFVGTRRDEETYYKIVWAQITKFKQQHRCPSVISCLAMVYTASRNSRKTGESAMRANFAFDTSNKGAPFVTAYCRLHRESSDQKQLLSSVSYLSRPRGSSVAQWFSFGVTHDESSPHVRELSKNKISYVYIRHTEFQLRSIAILTCISKY